MNIHMNIQWIFPNYAILPRLLPRNVQEARTFKDGFTYAVCPRCRISMEREYVRYCNNCGQKLGWEKYGDII